MGNMKVVAWPKYKKTGTPRQQKERRIEQISAGILADLLPDIAPESKNREATGYRRTKGLSR